MTEFKWVSLIGFMILCGLVTIVFGGLQCEKNKRQSCVTVSKSAQDYAICMNMRDR